MKLEFSSESLENTEISYSKKLHPVGPKLFHVVRRMDRHNEPNGRFSRFCEHT